MKIVQKRVFLQYGKVGEPSSAYTTIHKMEAEKFVALDSHSGGYPYATEIQSAHDFKTVEEARKYAGHFSGFYPREVTVTYEF